MKKGKVQVKLEENKGWRNEALILHKEFSENKKGMKYEQKATNEVPTNQLLLSSNINALSTQKLQTSTRVLNIP